MNVGVFSKNVKAQINLKQLFQIKFYFDKRFIIASPKSFTIVFMVVQLRNNAFVKI